MSLLAQTRIAILLAGLALAAMPAHGQIVSALDGSGNRVYFNEAPPPTKSAKAPVKGPVAAGNTSNSVRTNSAGFVVRNSPSPSNSSGASSVARERLEALIQTVAARHHVDPALVRAVVQVESGGNPEAVSRKGAMGLMQLMPETAVEMGVTKVFDPQENLDAGVRQLRILLVRYNGDLDKALAAYNAGAGAVDRAGGVPRIPETRDYVRKVTNNYFQSADAQPVIAQPSGQRLVAASTKTAAGNSASAGKTLTANTKSGSSVKSAGNTTASAKTTATANTSTAANTSASANTTAPDGTHHIYQVKDSQGRVVWVNE
jgi:soluble lytic murein transglycosylase-like protein